MHADSPKAASPMGINKNLEKDRRAVARMFNKRLYLECIVIRCWNCVGE
jgi:hypothetical protein